MHLPLFTYSSYGKCIQPEALPQALPITDGILLKSALSTGLTLYEPLPAEPTENTAIVRARVFLPCQRTQRLTFHKLTALGRTKSH